MPNPWWFRRGTDARRAPRTRLHAERLDDRTVPAAVNDAFTAQLNSTANAIDVLANDTGTGNTVSAIATPPSKGTAAIIANGAKVSYTPAADFFGNDSFTYEVTDGTGAKSTATVSVFVNRPPVAAADAATVQRGAAAATVDVLANDTDPDAGQSLRVVSVAQGLNGSVAIAENGTKVTYTPAADFAGNDTFTYTVSDLNGGLSTGTVTVRVNAPPVAANDTASVQKDSDVTTLPVLANDFTAESGETLTITSATQGDGGGTVVVVGNGTQLTYRPAAGFSGTDKFSYTISDGNGGKATATVSVRVNAPPTAADDTAAAQRDGGAVTVSVLANDTASPDTGETLTITAVTQGTNGKAVISGSAVSYTPNAGFAGSDTFTYTISDGNGGTDTATVTVRVNAPPTAAADAVTVQKNSGATTVAVLANDSSAPDTGETLTVTAVTQGTKGGTVALSTGGTGVTYTPAANFQGTDTFTYTISDGNGGTATATATVTVANNNPTAFADTVTVAQDSGQTSIPVLANDSTTPDTGETLTITAVTQGTRGGTVALAAGGTGVTYQPAPGFLGTDTFTYTITDGNGGTASATVTVNVARPTVRLTAAGSAAGSAPVVTVRNADGTVRFTITAFEDSFTGGVSAVTADLTGDGVDDIIATPGVGGGPLVKVFSGADGTEVRSYLAYEEGFRGGVGVALGDFDRDGVQDVAVAAGPGGGPRVRVFRGTDDAELLSFFAFDPAFTGGVNIAVGDANRDGVPDVVAGAGKGGGPNVRVFSGVDASQITSFWAFEEAFTGGVRVGIGDVTGDGRQDIFVGAGPGGGPRVRVFGGTNGRVSGDYLAFAATETGGIRLAARDANSDGRPDVLVASPTAVKAFDGLTNTEIVVPDALAMDFLGGVATA